MSNKWRRVNKWGRFKNYIVTPLFKALTFGFSVIVSSILCGAFVNELTVNNKVQWSRTFEILPTYLIILFLALIFVYNIFVYIAEKRSEKKIEQRIMRLNEGNNLNRCRECGAPNPLHSIWCRTCGAEIDK